MKAMGVIEDLLGEVYEGIDSWEELVSYKVILFSGFDALLCSAFPPRCSAAKRADSTRVRRALTCAYLGTDR